MIYGLWVGVIVYGFRVSCFVFRVSCVILRASCFILRVLYFVFRASYLVFHISYCVFHISCFVFLVSFFIFRVSSSVFRVSYFVSRISSFVFHISCFIFVSQISCFKFRVRESGWRSGDRGLFRVEGSELPDLPPTLHHKPFTNPEPWKMRVSEQRPDRWLYRGTSFTRKCAPLGHYSRPMPKVVGGS